MWPLGISLRAVTCTWHSSHPAGCPLWVLCMPHTQSSTRGVILHTAKGESEAQEGAIGRCLLCQPAPSPTANLQQCPRRGWAQSHQRGASAPRPPLRPARGTQDGASTPVTQAREPRPATLPLEEKLLGKQKGKHSLLGIPPVGQLEDHNWTPSGAVAARFPPLPGPSASGSPCF